MYTITKFGSITLPTGNTEYTASPVAPLLAFVQTTAGVFDADGSGRNRQNYPFSLSYKAAVVESTAAANRSTLDALRAAVGTRATLYRTADDNAAVQFCTARLVGMPFDRPYSNRNSVFEIGLDFQQLSQWHGALHGVGWTFDSGVDLDDSRSLDESPPITLTNAITLTTINHAGNIPTFDPLIHVTAGSDDLTSLTIWNITTECRLYYSGTVLTGRSLEIDTGACSVLNDGANDYSHLQLDYPIHKNARWFEFAPGDNQLSIVRFGGGSDATISFIFNDGWA